MKGVIQVADNPLLEAALTYIRRGWSVIPARRSDKKPALATWSEFQRRLPSEADANMWWGIKTNNNIGIAVITGAVSGLLVLDLDKGHGDGSIDGTQTVKEHGFEIPPTVCAMTPSGGFHYYFRHPNDGRRFGPFAGKLPGIDGRGDGGYVIAPPTTRSDGMPYVWEPGYSPDEIEIAPAPAWLLALWLTKSEPTRQPEQADANKDEGDRHFEDLALHGAPEGAWHNSIISMAGYLRAHGIPEGAAISLLTAWNRLRNSGPPEDDPLAEKVSDVYRRYDVPRRGLADGIEPAEPAEAFNYVVNEMSPRTADQLCAKHLNRRTAGAVHALEEGVTPEVILCLLIDVHDHNEGSAREILGKALFIHQRNKGGEQSA